MLTKDQIEKLIDQLADRGRTCPVCEEMTGKPHGYCDCGAFLKDRPKSHPIYLGDVLAKLHDMTREEDRDDYLDRLSKSTSGILIRLWSPCGLNKSLQQIISEAEWEDVEATDCCGSVEWEDLSEDKSTIHCHKCDCDDTTLCAPQRLKSPQARALLEFINDIFNNKP